MTAALCTGEARRLPHAMRQPAFYAPRRGSKDVAARKARLLWERVEGRREKREARAKGDTALCAKEKKKREEAPGGYCSLWL